MPPEAQGYIAQWRALALVSGAWATVGLAVGLHGAARAWSTLRAVRRHRRRALRLVALGDVVLLAALTTVALLFLVTSAGLVWLAGNYPAALATVLIALDGGVTAIYVAYAAAVALVSLALLAYLAFGGLALLEEELREATP